MIVTLTYVPVETVPVNSNTLVMDIFPVPLTSFIAREKLLYSLLLPAMVKYPRLFATAYPGPSSKYTEFFPVCDTETDMGSLIMTDAVATAGTTIMVAIIITVNRFLFISEVK